MIDTADVNVTSTVGPPSPAYPCRQALELIEEMFGLPPLQAIAKADMLEQLVANMRDTFIARLRDDPASPEAARRRAALEQINPVLSLILGVEFPGAGLDLKPLEQVRDILRGLLAQGLVAQEENS